MNYIVLDLEWNQPAYKGKLVTSPVTLYGEIIQIGAVKLDENFNIVSNYEILVKPKYYTRMHKKVSRLTHIKDNDLKYGYHFIVACKNFKKWCGDDFKFITWGNDDIGVLRDNLRIHEMSTDWLPETYDLQLIFSYQTKDCYEQISLLKAMEMVHESPYDAHDALNDAANTALVCSHLDMVKGISEYSQLKRVSKNNEAEAIGIDEFVKAYSKKADVIDDLELTQFKCPVSDEMIVCDGWIKQNIDKYIAIGKCSDGTEYFVRLKFRKKKGEHYYISRIVHELTAEFKQYYMDKKEKLEKQQMSMQTNFVFC